MPFIKGQPPPRKGETLSAPKGSSKPEVTPVKEVSPTVTSAPKTDSTQPTTPVPKYEDLGHQVARLAGLDPVKHFGAYDWGTKVERMG